MEVIAVHHYLARTVELCCQTPSSLRTINYIYGLRVTVQLPAVGMKFSGPRHPLAVVERSMGTRAPLPAPAIRTHTQTTLTANGPSLHLLEDLSLSAFTLLALMIPETASRTTSSSTMDQMRIPHPLDHIVGQTLT